MAPPFEFAHGSAEHVGLVRGTQEDRLFAGPRLVAVADGVGGNAGGEVAAEIAVGCMADPARFSTLAALGARAVKAHIRVKDRAERERANWSMATTLCALAVLEDDGCRLGAVNVGDSRLYALSGRSLVQVTRDHNRAGEMLAAGQITPQQARASHLQRELTRVVGYFLEVQVDCFSLNPPPAGARFMLCTDGLTGEVGNSRIKQALLEERDPQSAADRLVRMALDRHGRDNIAVAVADVPPSCEAPGVLRSVPGPLVADEYTLDGCWPPGRK